MLRSSVFLLVMIMLITTPTRAYEANNVSHFANINQEQPKILTKPEVKITAKTLPISYADAKTDEICAIAIAEAETEYQIKPRLLQTIASVESGRHSARLKRRVAWPWTIQAEGKGYYFATKEEAVVAAKSFYAEGITNIDVGCMQINMKYHGQAFKSIEDALDPKQNVAYSAKFLRRLYKQNGNNWQTTAMQYHSKNYEKGLIYKDRLERHYAEHIAPANTATLF